MSPIALAAAIDTVVADPSIGSEAIYVAQGDAPKPVRVISRRPDAVINFGGARLWSKTQILDIRVSDVATLHSGDLIEIGDEAFVVQGERCAIVSG